MKKKSYDEASVVRSLNKKMSVRVNVVSKTIEVVKDSYDVGNGSWGKIDYLCKVHHYTYMFVGSIGSKTKVFNDTLSDDTKVSKTSKREAKLNIVNSVKAAMKIKK